MTSTRGRERVFSGGEIGAKGMRENPCSGLGLPKQWEGVPELHRPNFGQLAASVLRKEL